MRNKNSSGSHGGIAPFGYKWIGRRLVIDSAEAPVRRLIFDLFLKHRRKKVVARLLNELGHRTRNGSLFSDTTVGRLLSDPIVKGCNELNADESALEPLIDDDLWKATQDLLGDNRAQQGSRLFTRLAYCDCGGKMLVSSGSSKYGCRACGRKIDENDLEEIFRAKLGDRSIFETSELFDRWYELSNSDRRLLVENICDRVVIGTGSIIIKISYFFPLNGPSSVRPFEEDLSGHLSDEALLSEREAARLLGVSKMTLLRRRHSGEISFFRVGARILYSKEKHLLPYLGKNEG